ncbi:Nuclear pore complex protein NUP58 [Raphanus sativus]|uniref:Nuclear pore complex protein NUP58-like n=1 Tax=Raphanus sativus TaxID=3726 RepID=A0A9W3CN35_RAPSA|nr:nuclear pore complex protein NUP58-like [Raphanus sativus]KAJ4872240.1 Nuclear pore complex protein NUP58 [Raphanus sativus]
MSSFNPFSTPQQPQQTPQSPFQTPQQTPQPPFQTPQQVSQPQSNSFFSQQPQSTSFFSQPQPQQQQQPPTFQPQQLLYLFTNDKAPASYSTEWTDLHPDSQNLLLEIEKKIMEYRTESQRLDQSSRLFDSSISTQGFESVASRIVQELGGISTTMDRQKAVLHELMLVVKDLLRNSEVAVGSFMMLQPSGGGGGAVVVSGGDSQQPQAQGVQQEEVQVSYFYRGIPKKPTAFLLQTVVRFEKYLGECRQWVEEVEQLLALDSDKYSRRVLVLESLPKVMSNVHDFFVHVAAKVENVHQYIESMRRAYLADQRRRGESNDPFLEADRRERAKQEAAAKRVHPTLHLPPAATTTTSTQTSTQVAGLITYSAATPEVSNSPQTPPANFPTSGAGLFPDTLASAPSISIFATPHTPVFGAPPTPRSLFGEQTPSNPATPSQFVSGLTPGSGANLSSMKRPSRSKYRTSRR